MTQSVVHLAKVLPCPDEAVSIEIERMLQFIAAWFRGECEPGAFQKGFAEALHPEFQRIQPSGRPLDRIQMIDALRDANGASRFFRVEARNIRLVRSTDGTSIATYEEHQRGARNSDIVNVRHAMVLFEHGPRLRWRYVHETSIAGGRITAIL